MINIAVMGYGTIGSGVVKVIDINGESIAKKVGEELNVKYVLDLRSFPGDPIEEKVVHDVDIILNDPDVKIVVETMGGVKPAYDFVKRALLAGKSVATSNKELVAKHGTELLEIAQEKNINFLFEASVGGGIPIIRPLNQCLTADEIYEITGILNGTTNYILTKMAKEGAEFDDVLKQAQANGYAERNPAADIEGFDACRKIAILSSLAYGSMVDFEDIHTEGITNISAVDFKYAAKLGRSIKLFGTSKKKDGKYFALVAPVMINENHALFAVNDVFNGILVKGNVVDQVMFYGRGAGSLPTASAVAADVIEAAKNLNNNMMKPWNAEKLVLSDISEDTKKFFVRISGVAEDKKAAVEAAFGDAEYITIDGLEEFAIITPVMSEAEYKAAAAKVDGIINMIRIEE